MKRFQGFPRRGRASGTWNIQAQRSGDDLAGDAFSGKYAFYVNC